MKKPEHCKGCPHFHNAGHAAALAHLQKYNVWCCKYGRPARKAIGQCKNEGGKPNGN